MTEYTQEPVECPDGPAVYRVYANVGPGTTVDVGHYEIAYDK